MKGNNILLRGDNTKLLFNGQCKSTTLMIQGEFILKGNATNTMDILTIILSIVAIHLHITPI